MKLDADSSEKLKQRIQSSLRQKGLTYADLSRMARVHPSQVSRICRGNFRTISHNVMQICINLDVILTTPESEELDIDPLAEELKRKILEVWDRTPADAKRLVKFLQQLAELRSGSRPIEV
jgi:transcriptional regulator with XRE-family HTH domain